MTMDKHRPRVTELKLDPRLEAVATEARAHGRMMRAAEVAEIVLEGRHSSKWVESEQEVTCRVDVLFMTLRGAPGSLSSQEPPARLEQSATRTDSCLPLPVKVFGSPPEVTVRRFVCSCRSER